MPDGHKSSTQFPVTATVQLGYESTNADPLSFSAGDLVRVAQTYTEDPEWSSWIWCEDAQGKRGWTPLQVLRIQGEWATATADYTASELTVAVGESLTVFKVLNGWGWAQTESGEWGWVPVRNLRPRK